MEFFFQSGWKIIQMDEFVHYTYESTIYGVLRVGILIKIKYANYVTYTTFSNLSCKESLWGVVGACHLYDWTFKKCLRFFILQFWKKMYQYKLKILKIIIWILIWLSYY